MSNEKFEIEIIKKLKEGLTQAIREKNVEATNNAFSDNCVMFLLAPPLSFKKNEDSSGDNDIEIWFSTWKNEIRLETKELVITCGNDIAFLHSLEHLTGTRTDNTETDTWFRETLCLKKINGKWKIIHQHQSFPMYMDGSEKSATDLKS
ncbi:YybH family protein [Algoriphagus chordae]|uniref:PhnB protein n=1 Tax=Algoriphagus chordae TaxID=237019 RepID=A0A2W7QD09_9BACT|nr:nuclear transport factor 2 family protein [Algoriphagus chordae]PZX46504.1 PhnB protein [Algoriphagus chordae]